MTDSVGESNANSDYSIIPVREGGERFEGETSHAGNQTLSGNEENEDESFASQIKTELSEKLPDPTCIIRVPKKLVRDNENFFVPQMVSIGPYHHGRKKLQGMEQVKQRYLQGLLDSKPPPDTSLVQLVKEIRSIEEFLRSCYDEKLDHVNRYEFVKMMVVDGCFIVRFLRMDIRFEHPGTDDPVFKVPGVYSAVKKDLLLLENQLPWKVVDCLWNLTVRAEPQDYSLDKFNVSLSHPYSPIKSRRKGTREIKHYLDQVRDLLVGSSQPSTDTYQYWNPIPPVTHLEEIGVKFKPASPEKAQLDINFDSIKGVMEIPLTTIEVNTESVLKNLIAYEQWHHECRFLSYAMLFANLIKSTKDLDSLIQKKIIYTELSKEDTVSLFNRLCNDTERISFSYSLPTGLVNTYYEERWLRRWLARIKNNYLYNPSSIWSVSNAVIIVLILTATQTVYSVLAYYK